MIRRLAAPLALLAMTLALFPLAARASEPSARVVYRDGVPRIELSGSWAGSRYSVARAASASGPFDELLASDALCTGECYALDHAAEPGRTYWYRFELWLPNGATEVYGPFPIAISPTLARAIGVTASPNPSGGPVSVRLMLAGPRGASALDAEAFVFDLGGRRVATVHRGAFPPGARTIAWDGRGDDGRTLGSGSYWLAFRAADGRRAVTRLVRAR